jgi:hypothetical protein
MIEKKEKKETKLIVRKLLKNTQATVTIPEYKAPSILNDPNRFFNKEMEETKKSMFFE